MYTLKVDNMSCGGCAARVTCAVQAVDPEAKVEVALKDRLVHVESTETGEVIANAISQGTIYTCPMYPEIRRAWPDSVP